MYRNVGDKIKIVAETICWLGIVGSVVYGFYVMFNDIENADVVLLQILIGLGIMIVGSLSSWIGSFVLYGFGQLIENSDIIVEETVKIEKLTVQIRNSSVKDSQQKKQNKKQFDINNLE